MKNKKTKKKIKGLSLVEVIIAIAIFGLLGSLLINVGISIRAHTKKAYRTNEKVSVQDPVADCQHKTGSHLVDASDPTVNIIVSANGKSITVQGDAYQVGDPTEDTSDMLAYERLNFKFVDEIKATASTT